MQTLEQSVRPSAEFTPSVESIFKYYSIPNEIKYVEDMRRREISQEDQEFYLRENVYKFLGEFVGKVPYTKISYRLGPHGFEYAGFPMSESYRRAAESAGPGSREETEWRGYQEVQKAFRDGATAVTWISPPKIADYSFAFRFQRDPDDPQKIAEYILRYPEKRGTVEKSSGVLMVVDQEHKYSHWSTFLKNPVGEDGEPNKNLEALLFATGVDVEAIRLSQLFEKRVDRELSLFIEQFAEAVSIGNFNFAEQLLVSIFNRAQEIREDLEKEFMSSTGHPSEDIHSFLRTYGDTEKALVIGGGNCPIVQTSPSNTIIEALIQGSSIENISHQSTDKLLCVQCPFCKKQVDADIKRGRSGKVIECPKCHATAPYSPN